MSGIKEKRRKMGCATTGSFFCVPGTYTPRRLALPMDGRYFKLPCEMFLGTQGRKVMRGQKKKEAVLPFCFSLVVKARVHSQDL